VSCATRGGRAREEANNSARKKPEAPKRGASGQLVQKNGGLWSISRKKKKGGGGERKENSKKTNFGGSKGDNKLQSGQT